MSDHAALILLFALIALIVATLVATAAGLLARHDQATTTQAIGRAGSAFAVTLTLIIAVITTVAPLIH